MRTVIAFALLAAAVAAAANPVPTEWPYLFVDFAGPPGGNYLPEFFPSANSVVDCFVGMACSDGGPDEAFHIQDHLEKPRWVVDCSDDVHGYCLAGNGALGKEHVPGDSDCDFMCYEQASPVTAASWGVVKALYR
jgi:hypothetical protein